MFNFSSIEHSYSRGTALTTKTTETTFKQNNNINKRALLEKKPSSSSLFHFFLFSLYSLSFSHYMEKKNNDRFITRGGYLAILFIVNHQSYISHSFCNFRADLEKEKIERISEQIFFSISRIHVLYIRASIETHIHKDRGEREGEKREEKEEKNARERKRQKDREREREENLRVQKILETPISFFFLPETKMCEICRCY